MKKFVHAICYFINMYIFFVVICGFMTVIPNLNMNFLPLKMMFLAAGFGYHTTYAVLGWFMPLIIICSLILIRKLLYKLIGEQDKFFGYVTSQEKEDKDLEENQEDMSDDDEDSNRTDRND